MTEGAVLGSGRASQLVAVGVDGTEVTSEAARYAAEVAGQRGWDLMLVHSYRDEAGGPDLEPADPLATSRAAERVVDDVLSLLQLGNHTRVHRMVTPSSAVDALCQVSRYVSLLVLGQPRVNHGDPLLDGRVGAAVAAGAHCPVVVVPPGWDPGGASGRQVVVALDGETPSEAALRIAFEEAELYGTGVLALLGVPGRPEDQFLADEGASLGVLLAQVERDHPGVQVRTLTFNGAARADVLRTSVAAAQVVVGRPRPDRESASWSRLAAGAVAAGSVCPVVIAPPEDTSGEAGAGGAAAYLGRGASSRTSSLLEATREARPGSPRDTEVSQTRGSDSRGSDSKGSDSKGPDTVQSRWRSGRRPSWWPKAG